MKKYLYSMVLTALCATNLFAQGQREGQGRNLGSPQTPASKNMRQQNYSTSSPSNMEGGTVTITAPDGSMFYAQVVDGRPQLSSRDVNQLESIVKRAQPEDTVTLEINGLSATYQMDYWRHSCCYWFFCNISCGAQASTRAMDLVEGKTITLAFSEGPQVKVQIRNGKPVMNTRIKNMIRDAMKQGYGELTTTFPDDGLVISGSVDSYENGCILCPKWWCNLLALLLWFPSY